MPFYELFGLAKPLLKRSQQFAILREAARAVYAGGGVLADIKSYGERITAYTISPPGKYKYNEVLTPALLLFRCYNLVSCLIGSVGYFLLTSCEGCVPSEFVLMSLLAN